MQRFQDVDSLPTLGSEAYEPSLDSEITILFMTNLKGCLSNAKFNIEE